MKMVLIIHGIGGHAGIHWQQWLHDNLLSSGFNVLMPDLPNSEHPDRQTWLGLIKKTLEGVTLDELIIVGHSLGVTTALDYVEQLDSSIDGLVTISGMAEDYGSELNSYFLNEKNIDFERVVKKVGWSEVLYGDNDPYVTQDALKSLAVSLGTQEIIISKGGHLNTEAGFTTFPLLLSRLSEHK
jgi:predicted alpha/beta hydrolase family esterase